MNFKRNSNQFMPTSCQLRVGQYARTFSHDSPAPHSYYPTMGRRQRRQPINPATNNNNNNINNNNNDNNNNNNNINDNKNINDKNNNNANNNNE